MNSTYSKLITGLMLIFIFATFAFAESKDAAILNIQQKMQKGITDEQKRRFEPSEKKAL